MWLLILTIALVRIRYPKKSASSFTRGSKWEEDQPPWFTILGRLMFPAIDASCELGGAWWKDGRRTSLILQKKMGILFVVRMDGKIPVTNKNDLLLYKINKRTHPKDKHSVSKVLMSPQKRIADYCC